jgi:hypothetical protein
VKLTYEQWCGVVVSGITLFICYGFDAASFPWWLKVLVFTMVVVGVLMVWNFRVTYLRIGKHV